MGKEKGFEQSFTTGNKMVDMSVRLFEIVYNQKYRSDQSKFFWQSVAMVTIGASLMLYSNNKANL